MGPIDCIGSSGYNAMSNITCTVPKESHSHYRRTGGIRPPLKYSGQGEVNGSNYHKDISRGEIWQEPWPGHFSHPLVKGPPIHTRG